MPAFLYSSLQDSKHPPGCSSLLHSVSCAVGTFHIPEELPRQIQDCSIHKGKTDYSKLPNCCQAQVLSLCEIAICEIPCWIEYIVHSQSCVMFRQCDIPVSPQNQFSLLVYTKPVCKTHVHNTSLQYRCIQNQFTVMCKHNQFAIHMYTEQI